MCAPKKVQYLNKIFYVPLFCNKCQVEWRSFRVVLMTCTFTPGFPLICPASTVAAHVDSSRRLPSQQQRFHQSLVDDINFSLEAFLWRLMTVVSENTQAFSTNSWKQNWQRNARRYRERETNGNKIPWDTIIIWLVKLYWIRSSKDMWALVLRL